MGERVGVEAAERPVSKAGGRIVFEAWTSPEGQVQTFPDDVAGDTERVEVESGWAHVVGYDQFGGRQVLRSFPSHVVSAVLYG